MSRKDLVDRAHELESLNQSQQPSLAAEFVYFLRTNKKWWMAPILLLLATAGLLVLLGSTGAAPFIYVLF